MVGAIRAVIGILFFLILGVGAILLQIFLSKKDSKWYGLILPMAGFGISLLLIVGIAVAGAFYRETETVRMMDENGVIVETRVTGTAEESDSMTVGTLIVTLNYIIVMNIPIAVLLIIYFICRGRRSKRKALERMQIQDLE